MTHGRQTRESLCKGKSKYAYKLRDSYYLRMLKIRSTATTSDVMDLIYHAGGQSIGKNRDTDMGTMKK
jgi:hypothetical protein